MRRPLLHTIIVGILLMALPLFSPILIQLQNDSTKSLAQTYVDHDFIAILGNEDFLEQATTEGWPGTGTVENPIIISGYRIQMARHLFRVVNTDLHFKFTDNYLDGVDGSWCGLYLANVSNGIIQNTIVRNSAISLHLVEIFNCSISENQLYDNYNEGIVLELACKGNKIIENNIYNNQLSGILLDFGCEDNNVTSNDIHDNGGNGIYIWPDSTTLSANHNWISNNTISRNSIGISVQGHENYITKNSISDSYSSGILCGGKNNAIISNIVSNNQRDGIKLYSYANGIFVGSNSILNNTGFGIAIGRTSDNNTVMFNDLILNNLTYQVWDDGENNVFLKNYYSSWNAPDENNDNIVDFGYPIGGDAESLDSTPSTIPLCEPPSWYTYSEVSATFASNANQENQEFQLRMLSLVTIVGVAIAILGLRGHKYRENLLEKNLK